ncbi:two-component sensor histidine kinase [Hasllibacter halocynthiae]|uniref:histidine kinase n=1 Tax=Hasllibacter halocynthiae TaxID=595589 RepID=A0A2T0X9E7_9RHOB|nr:sensor histidine kinase [Hasllibacter halocynthiae]PRY95543.1 two-component sensor histidine kinase [Hasllibacter halocynthiae]
MTKASSSFADRLRERLGGMDAVDAAGRALVALEAGRMGTWTLDIPSNMVTGDTVVADLLQLDFDDQPWPADQVYARMHPDDLPRVQVEVAASLEHDAFYEVEFRDIGVDLETDRARSRWLGARGHVTRRAPDGTALQMIGVNWDATEAKEAEARLEAMAEEMDHRVKNAFAAIRALVNMGERFGGDRASFARTLRGQVQALADTHAISSRLARGVGGAAVSVPALDVLEAALAPWKEGGGSRVVLQVQPGIVLPTADAATLAMLVYELAGEAAERGALGRSDGALRVTLARQEARHAAFIWEETVPGGVAGPTDQAPAAFGAVLAEQCVAALKGRMRREHGRGRLRFELDFPVAPAAAPAA